MDDDNPFRPIHVDFSTSEPAQLSSAALAGKGRRFGTYAVDYAAVLLLGVVVGAGSYLLGGDAGAAFIEGIPDLVLGVALILIYYGTFEGLAGRTLGKFIFGTRVLDENGGPPTAGQIVIRTLSRLIPFEPFSFLGESGWHDRLSKTKVVLVPRLKLE